MSRPTPLQYGYLVIGIICLSFAAIFFRFSEAAPPVVAFHRLAIAWLPLYIAVRILDSRNNAASPGELAPRPGRAPGSGPGSGAARDAERTSRSGVAPHSGQPSHSGSGAVAAPEADPARRSGMSPRSVSWVFPGFASRSDLYLAAAAGAALGLHYAVWFVSLEYTSVGSSTTLVTLQPIFVVLFSYFVFRERAGAMSLAGLLLAIAGAFVITSSDAMFSRDHLYGDVLALGAAVLIAVYIMIGRSVRHRVETLRYMNVVYASGALVLLIVCLLAKEALFGYEPRQWWVFAGLAFVSTLLGHTLLNWLLGSLRASTVSIFFLGEPVGASILAYLLLGETMGVRQMSGALLVLIGIAVFLLGGEARNRPLSGEGKGAASPPST